MSMAADDAIPPKDFPGLRPPPQLIFGSRWLQWQVIIPGLFVLSAIGIAYVERLGQAAYAKPGH